MRKSRASPGLSAGGCEPSGELDLTIFVACRNEQGNVGRSLNELMASLNVYPYSYEIIVVDDASTDGSVAEIEEFKRSQPNVDVTLTRNTRARGVNHNLCDAAMMGRGRYFQFIQRSIPKPEWKRSGLSSTCLEAPI